MQSNSIRSDLARIYFFFAVVPLILAGSLLLWYNFSSTQSSAQAAQQQKAALLANILEEALTQILEEPAQIADNRNFTSLSQAEQRAAMRSYLIRHENAQDITLIGAQGDDLIYLHRDLVGKDRMDASIDIEALASKLDADEGPLICCISFDDLTGEPVAIVITPIRDISTAERIYMLVTVQRLRPLSRLLDELPRSGSEQAYLLDKDGNVIAHHNTSVVLRRTVYSDIESGKPKAGLTGEVSYAGSQPIEIGGYPFRLVAERTRADVVASDIRSLFTILALLGLSALVLVGLVRNVTRRVMEPVEQITKNIGVVAKGDLSIRNSVNRDDEIGQLAESLNTMTAALESQHESELVAQQALASAEQNIRMLLESTGEALISTDHDGICEFINQSAMDILELEARKPGDDRTIDQLLNVFKLDSDASRAAERVIISQCLSQNSATMELVLRTRSRTIPIELRIRPVLRDEVHYGYVITFVDISDRRTAEAQLRQAQKMEAVGQITGGVAHDFNNLLAVMQGNIELLTLKIPDEKLLRYTEQVHDACQRGSSLTQQLLAFARRQPLSPTRVEVNSLIKRSHSMIRRVITENIDVELVLGVGVWSANVDETQLENALLNLAINARDALPEGGKLTIETANMEIDADYADLHEEVVPGQYVLVSVTDNGIGMTEATQNHAFEPFFTTKTSGKGSGLGLSMVYGFIKQSGGHIKIYSEAGEGTFIKMYLPRASQKPANGLVQETTAEELAAKGERVLVVEDDENVRAITVEMLESVGYRVIEAADADTAIALVDALQEDFPVLLFSDVVLTGTMNGRELSDRLLTQLPSLRVLFCSGYTKNAIIHNGQLDEGVELLTKPFTRTALLKRVRRILDMDN